MNPAEHIERTILGACLLEDEQTLELLVSMLRPTHFSLDSHKRIASTIARLYRQHRPVNSATVPQELATRNEIEAIGGWAYVSSLTEGLPMQLGTQAQDMINRLKEFWRRRQLLAVGEQLAEAEGSDSHELIQRTAADLERIVGDSISEDPLICNYTIPAWEKWERDRERPESRGLSFGIPDLDKAIGGLRPGHQIALGAASGVGKSTILAQILFTNGKAGVPCLAWLLEMSRDEMLGKLWSMEAQVRYGAVTDPHTANASEAKALREASYRVGEWPIRIEDKNITLDRVLGYSRLAINRYGTRIVGLDYIQRLKIEQAEKDEPLRQRVARASVGLADVVKGTDCASVLLSQLTTGRKSGVQAKPTMYDFRESSQIENDAHEIILLHREYDEKQGHYTNDGAILVPKVRFGSPCNLQARFDSKMAIWLADSSNTFSG